MKNPKNTEDYNCFAAYPSYCTDFQCFTSNWALHRQGSYYSATAKTAFLQSKRCPFELRKTVFRCVKDRLLQPEKHAFIQKNDRKMMKNDRFCCSKSNFTYQKRAVGDVE